MIDVPKLRVIMNSLRVMLEPQAQKCRAGPLEGKYMIWRGSWAALMQRCAKPYSIQHQERPQSEVQLPATHMQPYEPCGLLSPRAHLIDIIDL